MESFCIEQKGPARLPIREEFRGESRTGRIVLPCRLAVNDRPGGSFKQCLLVLPNHFGDAVPRRFLEIRAGSKIFGYVAPVLELPRNEKRDPPSDSEAIEL